MKTYMAKSEDFEDKKWILIDVEGKILGRIATKIANILRGKEKPVFTPHADVGDCVIVINAEKVHLTGKKWDDKIYYSHSGYPGGIKEITAKKLRDKDPTEIIKKAVWGMLPKNKWQKRWISRLKIYAGGSHPHSAQKPETLEVG